MANPLDTEGSFDPINPKIKLRANQSGVPLDHIDVDNNFEILRLKLNEVIDEALTDPAEQNVQADWNETNVGSDAFILNKPILSRVASSGNYEDLSNVPDEIITQNVQNISLAFSSIDLINDRTTSVETSLIELANSAGISLANTVSLSSGLTDTLTELRAEDATITERINTVESEYKAADTTLSDEFAALQLELANLTTSQVSLGNKSDTLGVSLSSYQSATNQEIANIQASLVSIQASVDGNTLSIGGINTSLEALRAEDVTINGLVSGHSTDISALQSDVTSLTTETNTLVPYIENTRVGVAIGDPAAAINYVSRNKASWIHGVLVWASPYVQITSDDAYIDITMPSGVVPDFGSLGSVYLESSDSGGATKQTMSTSRYINNGGVHIIRVYIPGLSTQFLRRTEFQLSFIVEDNS